MLHLAKLAVSLTKVARKERRQRENWEGACSCLAKSLHRVEGTHLPRVCVGHSRNGQETEKRMTCGLDVQTFLSHTKESQ